MRDYTRQQRSINRLGLSVPRNVHVRRRFDIKTIDLSHFSGINRVTSLEWMDSPTLALLVIKIGEPWWDVPLGTPPARCC